MAMKSVGENLQMKMDERGSSLQRRVLPKAKVGVSQDFSMQLRGLTEYLEIVTDNGGSATSYKTDTSTSSSNLALIVDPVAQSTAGIS
jgi:hypothetical protein